MLLVASLGVFLTGCGKGKSGAEETAAGGKTVFRTAMHTAPTSLDPALIQDVDTGELIQNVYEGLVSYDENNKLVPQLAESWTVEGGGKSFIFKLRANAKFHNGTPVTAEDVKFSLERNSDPAVKSPTASSYLSDIEGFAAHFNGKAKDLPGVMVIDPATVKITLDKPRPYFLGKLTYPCAFILSKDVAKRTEITAVADTIGTGPFKLAEYAPDQQLVLLANPDYYLGKPLVDELIRPVIKDAATRLNQYKDGSLDLLTIERQDLDAVNADPVLKAEMVNVPRPAIYYLGMNQDMYAPFKDVRVRRAFAMAIDRTRIATDIIKLPEAKGFLPPGITGARPDLAGIPFDPATARKLLAEAGFPNGKGLPALTITYRDGRPDSALLAVSAITDLKKNLNVDVSPKTMEWRAFLEARNAKKLQFVGLSWYADYLDPQNFLSFLLRTGATENRDGYSNPAFDKLVDEADTISDEARRTELYQQAEDLLIEDVARIPAYFGQDVILVKKKVSGVRSNLFGQMPHLKVKVN